MRFLRVPAKSGLHRQLPFSSLPRRQTGWALLVLAAGAGILLSVPPAFAAARSAGPTRIGPGMTSGPRAVPMTRAAAGRGAKDGAGETGTPPGSSGKPSGGTSTGAAAGSQSSLSSLPVIDQHKQNGSPPQSLVPGGMFIEGPAAAPFDLALFHRWLLTVLPVVDTPAADSRADARAVGASIHEGDVREAAKNLPQRIVATR